MLKFNSKLLILLFGLTIPQLNAAEVPQQPAKASLPKVFHASGEYLQRVRDIQLKNPDSSQFMPELKPLVLEIVDSMTQKIKSTPHLSQSEETMVLFDKMVCYANDEIQNNTINLNRLNYLCLQMSILLNPNLTKKFALFDQFNTFVAGDERLKIWHLRYDQAYEIARLTIEEVSKLQGEPIKNEELAVLLSSLNITIFKIGDRGLNAYPLVAGCPLYGIRTYLEALAEGITFVGYPLDEKCELHTGLIGAGEYAYAALHDLLHMFTLAPSLDPLKNKAHIRGISDVTKALLSAIGTKPIAEQSKALITYFIAIHELVNYSKGKFVLFDEGTSPREVFARIFEHATQRLEKEIPDSLAEKEQYYRSLFKIVGHMEDVIYFEDGTLEVIPGYPSDRKFKGEFGIAFRIGESSYTYSSDNFLNTFEHARRFSYSIVALLNLVPNIDRSYGKTYADYNPIAANRAIARLFQEFQAEYEPLFRS